MDYELFLFSTNDIKYIAKILVDITKNILKREIKVIDNNDIFIACGLFSFDIEIEEYEDLDFIRKHYEIDVNSRICIQVSSREFDQGIEEIFKIINYLLNYTKDNVLLLVNGSEQVLRRDKGILIFNESIDYIPYEEIDIPYKKEKLKII